MANRRSIAWAIAQRLAASGVRLALSDAGERLGENVRELAASLDDPLALPCDVASDDQIAEACMRIGEAFGGLDYLIRGAAFVPRTEQAARRRARVAARGAILADLHEEFDRRVPARLRGRAGHRVRLAQR